MRVSSLFGRIKSVERPSRALSCGFTGLCPEEIDGPERCEWDYVFGGILMSLLMEL